MPLPDDDPNRLTKQSQTHVKRNNLRLVLSTIIRHEPLSRADIVRRTHISKPTVSSLIEELLRRRIIAEIGRGESRGGRKPILLRFRSTCKYFLAIEMGRVGYHLAIADLKGSIIRKSAGELRPQHTRQEKMDFFRQVIFNLLAEAGIGLDYLLKIIYLAPGIYVEKGKALKWDSSFPDEGNRDMCAFLQSTFKRKVIAMHSTKLSLLGEKIAGKARGWSNAIYIDFAFGLGCSIMINGKIYFGTNNSAGEIGYFYSSLQEFKENPVRPYVLGILENKISGKALQEKGVQEATRNPKGVIMELARGDRSKITARTVFEAYGQQDPEAAAILRDSFAYFNMALCNVINLLAPELVIFGGGFSGAGKLLFELIASDLRERVLIMPRLEISELKNEASIIGGIHYLLENTDLLNDLYCQPS